MHGAPNLTGRNAKLWCAPEPQETLTENTGAPALPAELCQLCHGGAQKSSPSPGDADAADPGPDCEKDNSSLLVL